MNIDINKYLPLKLCFIIIITVKSTFNCLIVYQESKLES